MIRVIAAVGAPTHSTQYQPPKMKFYNNQVKKEEVKQDFGLILDKEISKLTIDILI